MSLLFSNLLKCEVIAGLIAVVVTLHVQIGIRSYLYMNIALIKVVFGLKMLQLKLQP